MFVAVHGGAGNHNQKSKADTKNGLRQACIQALSYYGETPRCSPLALVASTISTLEDLPQFNAGYGSNLTLDGDVECDASIMEGSNGNYGSVGAAAGVKNPIRLAHRILEYAKVPDALGRLPPLTLVSEGARKFAAAHADSVQLLHPDELVAPRARHEWMLWKERLRSAEACDNSITGLHDIQDTVGAVAWVRGGGTAAGVSSGGLLLKHPGRVGEAAVYGAGCWAQPGMTCSVSGAGEHIVRSNLARSLGEAFSMSDDDIDPHNVLYDIFIEKFWKPCKARGESNPNAGLILLRKSDESDAACLWCAFTTPSMAIAYASTVDPTPKALIFRRPKEMETQEGDKPRIFITAVKL